MSKIFNFIKGFLKLYIYKKFNKKFPLNVFFIVTNKCNLKCDYCYGEYYNRNGFKEFTTSEILSYLEQMKKMGTLFLQIQGGEPLIRNDINKIVRYSKKLNFNTDMITNGLLIKQKIDTVKLLDSICISLDGNKKLNDKYRGNGTFDKILESIMLCRKIKIPVRINSILTNDTDLYDIDFLMEFSKKNRCLLNFSSTFEFEPLTKNKKLDYFEYDRKKYNYLIDTIVEYKKKGYPVQFTAESYLISKNWPFNLNKIKVFDNKETENLNLPQCYHGDYVCFIDGDGQLYPCCNFWNDYKKINIKKIGFEKAFNMLDRSGCKGCYIYSYIDRNKLMNFDFKVLKNYFNNIIYDYKNKIL